MLLVPPVPRIPPFSNRNVAAHGGGGVSAGAYVMRTTTPTSTGNWDITDARLTGVTPKGAIIIASYAKVDGTAIDDGNLSYGVSDGTNGWVVSVNTEHGQTTTDTHNEISTSKCIMLNDAGTATAEIEGDVASMIDGGIRINMTTVDASNQRFVTVIFIVGDDFSTKAGSQDLGTGTTAITISGVGFEPEVVLTANGGGINVNANTTEAAFGFGVAHNGASVTERSIAWWDQGGVTTTALNQEIRDAYSDIHYASGSTKGNLTNFVSDGFDIDPAISNYNNADFVYFAITSGGTKSWKVGTYTTATGTGNQSTIGIGFQPGFVLMGNTVQTLLNTLQSDGAAGTVGMSAWDDTNQFSNTISSQDAVTTSNTQSLSDNIALKLVKHDGSANSTATLVSLDADGWTLNFTAVDAARYQWYLALEA